MARSGSISRISPNSCCRQSVRPISPARTWPWAQCEATWANLRELTSLPSTASSGPAHASSRFPRPPSIRIGTCSKMPWAPCALPRRRASPQPPHRARLHRRLGTPNRSAKRGRCPHFPETVSNLRWSRRSRMTSSSALRWVREAQPVSRPVRALAWPITRERPPASSASCPRARCGRLA